MSLASEFVSDRNIRIAYPKMIPIYTNTAQNNVHLLEIFRVCADGGPNISNSDHNATTHHCISCAKHLICTSAQESTIYQRIQRSEPFWTDIGRQFRWYHRCRRGCRHQLRLRRGGCGQGSCRWRCHRRNGRNTARRPEISHHQFKHETLAKPPFFQEKPHQMFEHRSFRNAWVVKITI